MWHADISINIYLNISICIYRLELSTNDDSAQQLLANNLYHNSSTASLLPNHGSMIHNSHYPYRQFAVQQPSPLIGSLNLSSSSSTTSSTPPTNSSSPPNPRPATLTLAGNTNTVSSTNQIHQNNSNNLYSNNNSNNNHLYHHNNLTTSSSTGCGSGSSGINNSVHNTRLNLLSSTTTSSLTKHSGILSSSTIHQHHPTPLDGLAALSSLGNSSLHLSNSISGSSSNSLGTPDLGMTHWLSDATSNAGKL